MKKNKDYFVGSGNVFADLGLPNPEERLAKAELALQINRLIKQKKLTQIAAAKLLGITQPKISALNNGKLSGFSLGRLMKFLNLLGQDITIKVAKVHPSKEPNIHVNVSLVKKMPFIKDPPSTLSRPAMQARKKKTSD